MVVMIQPTPTYHQYPDFKFIEYQAWTCCNLHGSWEGYGLLYQLVLKSSPLLKSHVRLLFLAQWTRDTLNQTGILLFLIPFLKCQKHITEVEERECHHCSNKTHRELKQ